MDLRLRQICLVARSKDQTVAEFGAVFGMRPVHGSGDLSPYGLPAKGPMFEGGKKVLDALGVENLIFSGGSDFLEVLYPTRPDGATLRFMNTRGGDAGYMLILQTGDVGPFKEFAKVADVRVIHEGHFPQYHDIHLHPKDCGGALLSMASHLPENIVNGPWYPAGKAWETMAASSAVTGIIAAELQSDQPRKLAERWGRLLGRAPSRTSKGWEIELDYGELRFVEATDGLGEGFSGFDIAVRDREKIETEARRLGLAVEDGVLKLCGMRIGLVG